jgi:VTC domain
MRPIDSMRPISLDELVARAPLLTRLDRKYILPIVDLPSVLGGLAGVVRVLEIDGRRDFGYQSRYFDTPQLHSYLGAAYRRRRRFKVRIRSYAETDLHFLEVKTRGPRGSTVKHRFAHEGGTHEERHFALSGPFRGQIDTVLDGARISSDWPLLPALTTRYRRTTLFVPATGSRVTIDTGLHWVRPDGSAVRIRNSAIVETKSDQSVSDVDRLLWSLRHRPCSVSKYGTGLAALRPDLPANHWRPVLRRYFVTEQTPSHLVEGRNSQEGAPS